MIRIVVPALRSVSIRRQSLCRASNLTAEVGSSSARMAIDFPQPFGRCAFFYSRPWRARVAGGDNQAVLESPPVGVGPDEGVEALFGNETCCRDAHVARRLELGDHLLRVGEPTAPGGHGTPQAKDCRD